VSDADRSRIVPSLPSPETPDRLPWVGVAVVAAVLVIGAGVLLVGFEREPPPPFLQGTTIVVSAGAQRDLADTDLHLAGSGSNLPLTRALGVAHAQRGGNKPIAHPSIGSGGGIRALLDGVIDVALVSRPLRPSEREHGLVASPYARVPVMVAVHDDVPERTIEPSVLLEIYSGATTHWSDGTPVVVLQREPGDSSHRAVSQVLPTFADINEQAYRAQRFRVIYHDSAMQEALATTVGAIGLHGSGRISSEHTYRALRIGGVPPTPEAVVEGDYPFFKDLSFVTRGQPTGEAKAFIEFAGSDEARAIIESFGCIVLPLDREVG
jgi:phosphate transport system substrate-binding protein